MNRALSISLLFFLLFMLSVPTSAWSRYMIKGQVVDAETGKPIENAAVYICWTKPGAGPPGLAGEDIVEVAETLTDSEGSFKIPKYSTFLKEYELTVYYKGYVCWNSRDIFPTYRKRKDFRIKDGMVIKLEHFKEEYSKEKHAIFTTTSSISSEGVFSEAIKPEREIEKEFWRRKPGESK